MTQQTSARAGIQGGCRFLMRSAASPAVSHSQPPPGTRLHPELLWKVSNPFPLQQEAPKLEFSEAVRCAQHPQAELAHVILQGSREKQLVAAAGGAPLRQDNFSN